MNKEKLLQDLEHSHNSGVISNDEYEKKKKDILEMKDEPEKNENNHATEQEQNETQKSKISDWILLFGVIIIVLGFIGFMVYVNISKEPPRTIEDLHKLNIEGKLEGYEGFLYKDLYSFINIDGFWYTQLESPSGQRIYDMNFRFNPEEVENIIIRGELDTELFNSAEDYYVTFNPTGTDFSNIALAAGDFNQHMIKVFSKVPIAACDRNETDVCIDRPIIDCNNTEKVVLYIKENNSTKVSFDDNCIIVEGTGLELVKGINRVLYFFYEFTI